MKLIGIGYWRSFYETQYPDPAWFVDESWDKNQREIILKYLKTGNEMPYASGGISWCRFRCGKVSMGGLEYTDGKYLWPEGLAHYVENHYLRLPDAVVNHMLINERITPIQVDNFEIDFSWWISQSGWNKDSKSFNGIHDHGLLTIEQIDDKFEKAQGKLLRDYLGKCYGIYGRLHFIDKLLINKRAEIKGRFVNARDFLNELPAIGLKGEYKDLSKEDFK